jgi:hypothetical protein
MRYVMWFLGGQPDPGINPDVGGGDYVNNYPSIFITIAVIALLIWAIERGSRKKRG